MNKKKHYTSNPINKIQTLAMPPTSFNQTASASWASWFAICQMQRLYTTFFQLPSSIKSIYKINDQSQWLCGDSNSQAKLCILLSWGLSSPGTAQSNVAFDLGTTLIHSQNQPWKSFFGPLLGSLISYPNRSHPGKELLSAWLNPHK